MKIFSVKTKCRKNVRRRTGARKRGVFLQTTANNNFLNFISIIASPNNSNNKSYLFAPSTVVISVLLVSWNKEMLLHIMIGRNTYVFLHRGVNL